MNVARMRLVDRWLGVPACFLLTMFRKLFGRRAPDVSFQPERILFVKLAEQGSTVLAQAALQTAIARVGRANVFFLLFAENRPILDLLGVLPPENVVEIDARGLARTVSGAISAVWRMRKLRIDAAIDLEFFARASAALAYLSGARWRIGYHAFGGEASYRGDLMTHRLSFNPYLHTSQTFQIMVQALEQPASQFPMFPLKPTPPEPPPGRFEADVVELADMRQMLARSYGDTGSDAPLLLNARPGQPMASPAQNRDDQGPLILLNANASDLIPLRRWAGDRYVELARRILAQYPRARIAFTGAPSEAAAAERLVAAVGSPRCVSMAGKTTLRQLLVLCALADVLVSNDSGPAHFATLTDVDVVVLFGPETPRLFAARSPRTHPLWAGLACSPCINAFNNRASPCSNNVCMQSITVDEVCNAVCRCLAARSGKEVDALAAAA